MSKNIKITIIKDLVVNTVKNVTFHRGQTEKGADGNNAEAAFHMEAGDEQYHLRLLERGYYTNLELLKTRIVTFLDGEGNLSEDPLIDEKEESGQNIIVLKVSDRFNNGLVKSLARLCSRFIEDSMLSDWYAATDSDKSVYFSGIAEKDMVAIRDTFAKTSPDTPVYKFPTAINITYPVIQERGGIPGFVTPENESLVDPSILFNNPWLVSVGEVSEITYTLTGEDDKAPLDDILIRCDNSCCRPRIAHDGHWQIVAHSIGYTIVTLFSRHNDKVYSKFAIRVTA